MKQLFVAAVLGLFSAVLPNALAQEGERHEHGSHPECPLPKTALDVVRCALNEHPIAKRAILASEHSKTLTDVAEQIPNPDLDIEATFGSGDSRGDSSTDIGLLQPIEIGGKRSSRIESAKAQAATSKAEATEVQADIVRETIRNLHRLRQLDLEKSVLQNTIETLEKTIAQQNSRPALSPEQQVALSVYRMAAADARLKQSELFEEERKIEHYFHISTGHSLEELRPILPKSPDSWPELKSLEGSNNNSPALMKAMADRSLSLAELSLARSQAWPTLKLGPMARIDKSGSQSENQYGFRLMMDLPAFNLNSGGKAHALAGVQKAESLIELTRKEESHERAEQLKVYQSAVQALRDAPSLATIDKDFSKNQSLARRGVVSGALLIEFHRQRSDLIHSRNSRELKAIEALWLIHKLDGRIFTELL